MSPNDQSKVNASLYVGLLNDYTNVDFSYFAWWVFLERLIINNIHDYDNTDRKTLWIIAVKDVPISEEDFLRYKSAQTWGN